MPEHSALADSFITRLRDEDDVERTKAGSEWQLNGKAHHSVIKCVKLKRQTRRSFRLKGIFCICIHAHIFIHTFLCVWICTVQ